MSTRSAAMDDLRWGRPLSPEAICLDPEELRQAAAVLVPGEDPEQAWIRYLRALALLGLRRWLKQRGASVLVGPELEPEAPERLLAIQGLATQLLCVSALAEEAPVPLGPWSQEATAPQLALLAQVDEENGVVEFPGVMDAAAVVAEIQKLRSADQEAIELPVQLFNGGLERLLRWVTLAGPEALPRAGLVAGNSAGSDDPLAGLKEWLAQLLGSATLIPLPVLGTRGGSVPELRLITPQVQLADDGSAFAEAVCATPTIWAEAPLAEVVIENEGEVVWQQLATRRNPIEGPIAWPLAALESGQQITIRLRPWGAPGGAYAVLNLTAPDSAALQNGEEAIRRQLRDRQATDQRTTAKASVKDQDLASEVRARLWLAHQKGSGEELLTTLPREEELKRAISELSEALGEDHPDVATALNNLAGLYYDKQLYSQAVPLCQRALAIREQALGANHPDTSTSLNNLAELYRAQGLYSQAEPLYQRSLAACEQVLGADHPQAVANLINLARLYHDQKLYSQAEPLYLRVLAMREQSLGADHPITAISLNDLASLYHDQGLYGQAESLYQRSLAIDEQALGSEHSNTATSLNNLALLYHDKGLYSQALSLYQRALAIREQVLGADHPGTATTLNNLAGLYCDQGLYSQAVPLCQRALVIREKALGAGHPDTATSLNALALLYYSQGLYSQAEPLYQRALANSEQLRGVDHPDNATILNNLAGLYHAQGLYGQAEPLYQRALAINEKILGADHLDNANILNNLASLFHAQGFSSQAELLFQRALAIREHVLGAEHPKTANSLNNLAILCHAQGLCDQAELLCQRALGINEQALGVDHPDTAACLNNLAWLYRDRGLYVQAKPLCQRALVIREQALGSDHPETATSLDNLAWLRLLAARQLPQPADLGPSVALFARSLRSRLAWLIREAPLMAAANRRQLPGLQGALEQLPMDMATIDLESARFLLFARLNVHGLLQQIEQRQAEVSRLPGEHQALVQRLRYLGTVLASTQVQPQQRQQLAAERNDLEAQLYRLLPDLQLSPVELADVAAALPSLSALIEVQRYTPRSAITLDPDTTPRYLAFILLPGASLEVIDLGPAPPLEAAIEEALSATVGCFADALEAWRDLSERLISPLLARLGGCTSWFLTLDGELHRIPFHCLPLPGRPDQVLVEQIQLRVLTSGRDLLDRAATQRRADGMTPALVLADPAFDHSAGPSNADSGGHLSRSRDMCSLKVWPPLPATAREGKELTELLGADLRAGAAATTLAVQQVQHPLVLHIATHGFFLPNQGEAQARPEQPWLAPQGHDLLANFRGEDPLLRSGLVFAGANHPVANPEDDDGYLTAQEAVQLDLQGTELVTLSACDTGRGDVHTGEGVYGLQRALIVAGARSLLLSLWQVSDEATCEFMLRFYTLLKQGAGRSEALVTVQREFRQHDNVVWRHPFYWGAWQLLGDGGPIAGL